MKTSRSTACRHHGQILGSVLGRLSALVVAVSGPLYGQMLVPATGELDSYAVAAPVHRAGESATLLPDSRWLMVGGGGTPESLSSIRFLDEANLAAQPVIGGKLIIGRTGHTATVLPDGSTLIWGGSNLKGHLVEAAELIEAGKSAPRLIPDTSLTFRTRHTATLLTNGLVLIAGGIGSDGQTVELSELFNPETGRAEPIVAAMGIPRADHRSALLANGNDLIWGGRNDTGAQVGQPEVYSLDSLGFKTPVAGDGSLPQQNLSQLAPKLAASLPENEAIDIPIDSRISIRFSEALRLATINSTTLTLVGPGGVVETQVVGTEAGILAFISPKQDLSPNATYTVFLSGVVSRVGRPLPFASFNFTTEQIDASDGNGSRERNGWGPRRTSRNRVPGTAAGYPVRPVAEVGNGVSALELADEQAKDDGSDSEDWIPGEANRHGNWQILGLEADPKLLAVPGLVARLKAASNQTAISGQIVRLNGKPLAGVPVSAAGQTATTDPSGRFLLAGVPAGKHQLKIDGTAVVSRGRHYTKHFIQVETASGKTTNIPDPIFLPRVDPSTEVSISSPAIREIVLTHPAMPGLEVHIPKGAVLREYDGQIVTKLSLTPLPVDRAPYPAPINFSVYFTLQPGGAFVEGDPAKAIRIVYPNYQGLPRGTPIDFWNYDPNGGGWKVYGKGVVSSDGKRVIPNDGVGFRQIMTFGFGLGGAGAKTPALTGVTCGGCMVADPVDVATGLFAHTVTDIAIKDVVPISVTRTYRQSDSISRAFGIGTNLSYDMYLCPPASGGNTCPDQTSSPTTIDLVMNDSARISFILTSGSFGSNAVWTNSNSPTAFNGATLTQQATSDGNRFVITTRDRAVMVFAAHEPNQLQSITDRNGNTVTLTLAAGVSGNITRITSPNGRYIQLQYDLSNRITSASDHFGRNVTYDYDASGRLWKAHDLAGNIETYEYLDATDPARLTNITDRRGHLVTQNVYAGGNGRISKQTLADTTFWLFDYTINADCPAGTPRQTSVTNPRGFVTVRCFNASGYVTREIRATGQAGFQQTFNYTRNARNLVETIQDPLGRTTKMTYDLFGNVLTTTRLFGTVDAVTQTMTYDETFHQLATYKDELNRTWLMARDDRGNLRAVTDPLGHSTTIGYNGQGQPNLISDALSHTTTIGYQQADLASVIDALSRTSTIYTDTIGRVSATKDPLGNRTQHEYDPLDRVTKITDAIKGETSLAYDPNGNLTSFTDPREIGSHGYTYDDRDRLFKYTDPLGRFATYLYDGLNNLKSVTDRKLQTTQYEYDPLNRLKLVTFNSGATIQVQNYDAGDRPQTAIDSAIPNGTISWQYDLLDRVTQETTNVGSVTYAYYANGLRKSMQAGAQAKLTYCYDIANRLQKIMTGADCASPMGVQVAYTYDNADRLQTLTLPNGIVQTYAFDNADQLTSILYAKGATSFGGVIYGYDVAGRRTSRQSGALDATGVPATVSRTRYDAANRLNEWGTQTLSYDSNGNLTNDGAKSYTWNERDQLYFLTGGAGIVYDLIGRRRSVGTRSYQYDGDNVVQEFNPAVSYVTGLGIDETYGRTDAAGTSSYLRDGLGSTIGLSATGSAIETKYSYDGYGGTATSGTASSNRQGFAGRENDGTGLYYNRARYYSPAHGRFISQDPIGLAGGANEYAYVGGDPVNAIDPNGLDTLVITGGMRETTNPFGHSASAIQGLGVYSYGNGTPLGSSATLYVQAQSQLRNQLITLIPTTPAQDAAALAFFNEHPGMNSVGKVDNCSVRTSEGLQAAGVPLEGSMFPGGLGRSAAGLPGAQSFFIPQGGPIPEALTYILRRF